MDPSRCDLIVPVIPESLHASKHVPRSIAVIVFIILVHSAVQILRTGTSLLFMRMERMAGGRQRIGVTV